MGRSEGENRTGLKSGMLSQVFAMTDAAGLRQSILGRLDAEARASAETTLADFATAAGTLQSVGKKFNRHAVRIGEQSLIKNLPSAEQLRAQRALNKAQEGIEDLPQGSALAQLLRRSALKK
jgi:hypothetical protein